MVGTEDYGVAAVEAECDLLGPPIAFTIHLERPKRSGFDVDIELFSGSDEDVSAIGLAP